MNPIEQNIKNALNLDKLSPQEQQDIILRVGTLIYQNVLMRVMELMNEEQEDEFEKLLDANASPESIFEFLKKAAPSLEIIIGEEAAKFRDRSSNIMNQIGN